MANLGTKTTGKRHRPGRYQRRRREVKGNQTESARGGAGRGRPALQPRLSEHRMTDGEIVKERFAVPLAWLTRRHAGQLVAWRSEAGRDGGAAHCRSGLGRVRASHSGPAVGRRSRQSTRTEARSPDVRVCEDVWVVCPTLVHASAQRGSACSRYRASEAPYRRSAE